MTRISLLLGLLLCLPQAALAQSPAGEDGEKKDAKRAPKKAPEVVRLEKLLADFDAAAAGPDRAALDRIDADLKKIVREELAEGRREIRERRRARAKKAEKAEEKKASGDRRRARRAYIERRRIALRLGALYGKLDPRLLVKKRRYVVKLLDLAREEHPRPGTRRRPR